VTGMNDGCIINLGDLALLPATSKPLAAVDFVPMYKEFREQLDDERHEDMATGDDAELLVTQRGPVVTYISPAPETDKLTAEVARCSIKSGQ